MGVLEDWQEEHATSSLVFTGSKLDASFPSLLSLQNIHLCKTQDELNIRSSDCCATGVALILTEILKELSLSLRHFSICLDCYYAITFNCFLYQQTQYLKAKPLFLVKMLSLCWFLA